MSDAVIRGPVCCCSTWAAILYSIVTAATHHSSCELKHGSALEAWPKAGVCAPTSLSHEGAALLRAPALVQLRQVRHLKLAHQEVVGVPHIHQVKQHVANYATAPLHDIGEVYLDDVNHAFRPDSKEPKSPSEAVNTKASTPLDFAAIIHSAGFNLLLCVGYFAFFGAVWQSFPKVYANNVLLRRVPTVPANSCFGWAVASMRVTVDEVANCVGLDAALQLEFMHLATKLLAVVGVPTLCIMWPLQYGCGWGDDPVAATKEGSGIHWLYAIFVWFTLGTMHRAVYAAQKSFQQRRYTWLRERPSPWATTVWVQNIPLAHRSDSKLKRYFDERIGGNVVQSAYVIRRTAALESLMNCAAECQRRLQAAEGLLRKDLAGVKQKDRLQMEVEICQLNEEVKHAATAVAAERTRVEEALVADNPQVLAASGWVTFIRRQDAARALRSGASLGPGDGTFLVAPAPAPEDVVYADLRHDPKDRARRWCAGYVVLAMLFLGFVPLVCFIIPLTSVDVLQRVSVFRYVFSLSDVLVRLWRGVVPSLVLSILMSLVPTALKLLFENFFWLGSNGAYQECIQQWYFLFLVSFVLLVTAIGVSLWHIWTMLVEDPYSFLLLLGTYLPGAADFFIKYLTVQWAGEAMQLLRLSNFVKFLYYRRTSDEAVAREQAEPEDQAHDGIGARSSRLTLILVIALVFSTLAPIICLVAMVNFALARLVMGYLIVFAEVQKPDRGGVFWCKQLKNLQLGMMVYVALMLGVTLRGARSFGPSAVIAAGFGFLLFTYSRFDKEFMWQQLPQEELEALDAREALAGGKDAGCVDAYVQPELAVTPR